MAQCTLFFPQQQNLFSLFLYNIAQKKAPILFQLNFKITKYAKSYIVLQQKGHSRVKKFQVFYSGLLQTTP